MRYKQGTIGRIFALKLDSGEMVPDAIIDFSAKHSVQSALVLFVGGADAESCLVVGPEAGRGDEIIPIVHCLGGIQEVLAVGTLFPDEEGRPSLHMHAATGREGTATVGCTRAGVKVWLIGEVILLEILGIGGCRRKDPKTGFQMLQLGSKQAK